jgi:Protein of unknown function (DUF2381)
MIRLLGVSIPVVLLFALAARPARAQGEHAGYRELLVDQGGTFAVDVHPAIVTVLYFPGAVTSAINSDDRRFSVKVMGDSVVLRPVQGIAADAAANLTLATEAFKVSVMLRIAERPSQAVAQVFFRKRGEVEAFNARVATEVDRLHRGLAEHFDARHRALDREVLRETEGNIIERLLRRHAILDLGRIARNDHNVIVRVQRGVWVGNELYLYFEIQNRDSEPYQLARVQVIGYDPKKDHAGSLEFRASVRPHEGLIGLVPMDERGHGIVCVRDADRLAGEPITLMVSEPKGRRAVHVEGIRWR